MKQFYLWIVALLFFIVGCGTPKAVIQSKRVIKGNWSLETITYSEKGAFNVSLFNDASKECFEKSVWKFISNNNSGTYSINKENCNLGDRNFIFSVKEENKETGLYTVIVKPTTKLGKPDKGQKIGFSLRLSQLEETSMQWIQQVSLDGVPFYIYMNFSKIN